MGIYLNGLWIQCDAKFSDDCDQETEVRPEAGNGQWYEEGTAPNLNGLKSYLNQEFNELDSGSMYKRAHVHGWTAMIERGDYTGNRVNCYCPKHASLRRLEKESVRCEKKYCNPEYEVGDFHYMYERGLGWVGYEWDKREGEGFEIQLNSLGAEYRKEDILLEISFRQLELNMLRYEVGDLEANSDECKKIIRESLGGININGEWRTYDC